MMNVKHLTWACIFTFWCIKSACCKDYTQSETARLEKNSIINGGSYFIVASKMVKPGQLYSVSITVSMQTEPVQVRASIKKNGIEVSLQSVTVENDVPQILFLKIPARSSPGEYKLCVEGLDHQTLKTKIFANETTLIFSYRSTAIFVQLDKSLYMQGDTVNFRTIFINTQLKFIDETVQINILDPNGIIMRQWDSKKSKNGIISLSYKLSDQPVFGDWKIKVIASEQVEEITFSVEEYYQTIFEVNVVMPEFFLNSETYIQGLVTANYTSGSPVKGNLTLKAIVKPINSSISHKMNTTLVKSYEEHFCENDSNNTMVKYLNFTNKFSLCGITTKLNFNESVSSLESFYGVHEFKYPLKELFIDVSNIEEKEIIIVATVGDTSLDRVIEGYSITRIVSSCIKIKFLGDSPQVFKPGMPITVYILTSCYDNYLLTSKMLFSSVLDVSTSIEIEGGRIEKMPTRRLNMMDKHPGVWEYNIDLNQKLDNQSASSKLVNELGQIRYIKIKATLTYGLGRKVKSELLILPHFTVNNQHITITTSTVTPKVDEYIKLHIKSNHYIKRFHFVIIVKGVILLNEVQDMFGFERIMDITLTAEMLPVATAVVWKVGNYGNIIVDRLIFPVYGITTNKFEVYIRTEKNSTGYKVNVEVHGKPGSYVGLSAVDSSIYSIQVGNELTYNKVIAKMANFDEFTNDTAKHTWKSHEGNIIDMLHFPSSTYGLDANRTFEYAGLIVLSNFVLPRNPYFCNAKKDECVGFKYVNTDKTICNNGNDTKLSSLHKYRFNRIHKQYKNVWLWKDIIIGDNGKSILEVPVPIKPIHWKLFGFSMSSSMEFRMLNNSIEYIPTLPFTINVEMPNTCIKGEQVGIRVTVFNYKIYEIMATLILPKSSDYQVFNASISPNSSSEYKFVTSVEAQDAIIVYIPIIPMRLGEIYVTINASTSMDEDLVTRKLHVESAGFPQYRHRSVLVNLSNITNITKYIQVGMTRSAKIPLVNGSTSARFSIVSDIVGPIFPTMPINATSLLNLPVASAEQNIFGFAMTMYTLMYIKDYKPRNKTLERNAIYNMNIMYQKQLSYMKPDGSFSTFRSDRNKSDSSVWLTTYCTKLFHEAKYQIFVDPSVIEKSVEWILQHQNENGAFYESTYLPNKKYRRSFKFDNITLTAHVIIMLKSLDMQTSQLSIRVARAQKKAVLFLQSNTNLVLDYGQDCDLAKVTYALMISNSRKTDDAYIELFARSRMKRGLIYWERKSARHQSFAIKNNSQILFPKHHNQYDSENIEATAYGLMVSIAKGDNFSSNIINWLNTQRLTDSGWASTLDTATVMQALVAYRFYQPIQNRFNLSITLQAMYLPSNTHTIFINHNNRYEVQYFDIPSSWNFIKVQVTGTGYAIIQTSLQYNLDPAMFQTKPPVPAFDLSAKLYLYGKNGSLITYVSCQRWTLQTESERSGPAVLDITIPTGYIVQQQDLDSYIWSSGLTNLQTAIIQERKVSFFFDYLNQNETCINLTVARLYPVANMYRYIPIQIYDYYSPERFNETIFDALPLHELDMWQVCASIKCPYFWIQNSVINQFHHSSTKKPTTSHPSRSSNSMAVASLSNMSFILICFYFLIVG